MQQAEHDELPEDADRFFLELQDDLQIDQQIGDRQQLGFRVKHQIVAYRKDDRRYRGDVGHESTDLYPPPKIGDQQTRAAGQ